MNQRCYWIERPCKLSSVCEFRQQGKPLPLFALMEAFLDSEATNPRDKIYGFLDIAAEVADAVFVPDNTILPEVLFKSVTKFVIT